MASSQTQYQVSFNETDANNFLSFRGIQPKIKQRPDSISFGKKSFLTNSSTYLNSDSNSNFNSNSNLFSNSITNSQVNSTSQLGAQNKKSPDEASRLSAYKQNYTYLGAEPHLTERVKAKGGAFGPNNHELTYAYKSNVPITIEPPKSPPTVPRTVQGNRIKTSYGLKNSLNLDFSAAISEKHPRGPSANEQTVNRANTSSNAELFGKKLPHNDLFSTINERPNITSYDLRSVWIPKKYPGRNMFFSHLDSSMFPGKYDETENVWNNLKESSRLDRQNSNMNFNEINKLTATPSSNKFSSAMQKNSQMEQSRTGSVNKNVSYIINSCNKSIVPIIKTNNLAAAELTKSKNYTSNYLYHFH